MQIYKAPTLAIQKNCCLSRWERKETSRACGLGFHYFFLFGSYLSAVCYSVWVTGTLQRWCSEKDSKLPSWSCSITHRMSAVLRKLWIALKLKFKLTRAGLHWRAPPKEGVSFSCHSELSRWSPKEFLWMSSSGLSSFGGNWRLLGKTFSGNQSVWGDIYLFIRSFTEFTPAVTKNEHLTAQIPPSPEIRSGFNTPREQRGQMILAVSAGAVSQPLCQGCCSWGWWKPSRFP